MGLKTVFLLFFTIKTCQSNVLQTSEIKTFDIDNFDHIFIFNEQQQLIKTNIKDSNYKIQSMANFGFQPWIDAGFPLNIALFYPDNGNIVLVDNQLNILNNKQIGANSSFNVSHFGRAVDGDFLLFDQATQTLKKITLEGKLITESIRNTQIIASETHSIYDFGNEIYLQNNTDIEVISPNMVWLKTLKNATIIRSYLKPIIWQNNQLTDLEGNKIAAFGNDTMPVALFKNKCIIKNKNKLILQAI